MFRVEGFDKAMSGCRRGGVDGLFELRYECVKYGCGRWVAEEGRVK